MGVCVFGAAAFLWVVGELAMPAGAPRGGAADATSARSRAQELNSPAIGRGRVWFSVRTYSSERPAEV